MTTTGTQQQLIEKLRNQNISAKFDGKFLHCETIPPAGKRQRPYKFSFAFDDPSTCSGAVLAGRVSNKAAIPITFDVAATISSFNECGEFIMEEDTEEPAPATGE